MQIPFANGILIILCKLDQLHAYYMEFFLFNDIDLNLGNSLFNSLT